MSRTLAISPMIPSFNMPETARFFREALGFAALMDTPEYAIYQKDNLTIHILPAGKEIGQMELYMEVDDVDGLWASIEDKVQRLKVRAPFDRDYGMREVHIEVPQTNTLLFIGQTIER